MQILIPKRGNKKSLMSTVQMNAADVFRRNRLKRLSDHNSRSKALNDLQNYLQLPNAPLRIECYDMSHMQGSNYVGSMVVMEDAILKKKDYRKFKIKSVAGNDDYAAMAEVIRRRLQNLLKAEKKPDLELSSFAYPPHLLLVDGGKGQLSAAVKVLEDLGLADRVPVASIAKKFEEIYVPGESNPVEIPRDSEALYLLQRIRDESHRFAVTYHRSLRTKELKKSILDDISGLGPVRKQKILNHFGTIGEIRKATLQDFTVLPWLPDNVAEAIYEKCSK